MKLKATELKSDFFTREKIVLIEGHKVANIGSKKINYFKGSIEDFNDLLESINLDDEDLVLASQQQKDDLYLYGAVSL